MTVWHWAVHFLAGIVIFVLAMGILAEHDWRSWYADHYEIEQARADEFEDLANRAVTAGERWMAEAQACRAAQ